MERQRLVVFSGAGISAESGLRTFRDSDGLWEEYRIEDVATPEAWHRDPVTVLRFYDQRRAQVIAALPNAAHMAIAQLQKQFDVVVITQNIDDLHERAGSEPVVHLHGEIVMARSTKDPDLIARLEKPTIELGDRCALGSQLRPHIVWFGEAVPMMEPAIELIARADALLVVGTSLNVYPAAGLLQYTPSNCPITLVDPAEVALRKAGVKHIKAKASEGVPLLASGWMKNGSISA